MAGMGGYGGRGGRGGMGGRGGPMGGPPQMQLPPPVTLNRETTCPLLLRVFPKLNGHHTLAEFAERGKEPKDEMQIYTWKDATLKELAELVQDVQPTARTARARISFAFIYPDRHGRNVLRQVGQVFGGSHRRSDDDNKQLAQLNFQTGDFLSVAIFQS